MTDVRFYNLEDISDNKLRFVVIAARFQNQWIFSKHRERETWDIPGGHIEPGETAMEAARRELWEETGAEEAEISPVCVYSVSKDGGTKYGLLCFAYIQRLGRLPQTSEMEKILLSDCLPRELTYPDIYPALYNGIQGWLNTQSNAGELWDVYDENRRPTGRFHRRGDLLKAGEYHLVVHIWIRNHRGQYLLTKRAPNKGFPNMWEVTGGSALAGDDSRTAALREVREETGVILNPENGCCVFSVRKGDYFRDVWLFHQDVELDKVVLQQGETTDKMLADKDQILLLKNQDVFVPYDYLDALFAAAELTNSDPEL